MGVRAWRSNRADRVRERKARMRALQPTRRDLVYQMSNLSVTVAIWSFAAYQAAVNGWEWVAIAFVAVAVFYSGPIIIAAHELLRHRHPVQVRERAVCNECGDVEMPWSMQRHLRSHGHGAAGAHLLGEHDSTGT